MSKLFDDLTDIEWSNLDEKRWDEKCVDAFILSHFSKFEEWLSFKNRPLGDFDKQQINFCEANNDKFMEFSFNFFNNGHKNE